MLPADFFNAIGRDRSLTRAAGIIERRGGRPVLAASAVLLALGLLALGPAPTLPAFVAAWAVIRIGMGAGLYDPAFSALGRLYGDEARSAINQVTLFGGFPSTVCWPLGAFLAGYLGWCGTCLTYAVLQIAVVLPLYLLGLPREAEREPQAASVSGMPPGHVRPEQRTAFVLLAAGFTLAYGIMTVVAVHLLALLQARRLALAAAVGLGVLVGPSQVGSRLLEVSLGRSMHPIWSLLASWALVAVSLGISPSCRTAPPRLASSAMGWAAASAPSRAAPCRWPCSAAKATPSSWAASRFRPCSPRRRR